jgi:GPH family glycoside/pentoside/hexuronide:cation symporter
VEKGNLSILSRGTCTRGVALMNELVLPRIKEDCKNLQAYAVFGALLAAAGLPIYIHAPKFFVDQYGVSLAALGSVLFGLRLLDVVQDPLFGWISQRLGRQRALAVSGACLIMALGMLGMFAIPPMLSPLLWFGITLTMVFSAFSFLTINFYAQGVQKASTLGPHGHFRLAQWRETGGLVGVCIAAIAPVVLGFALDQPFVGFAVGFAILALVATRMMRREWAVSPKVTSSLSGFSVVLRDAHARQLLLIACVNTAPVAVSSTLFLFYVEARLDAPGLEGPLLLLFFVSAALSVSVWSKWANEIGAKKVLMMSMTISIFAFGFASFLGSGDWLAFSVICVATGAALGADLTILPALFSKRMEEISPSASEGFGLWSFCTKLTLAIAAVTLLPTLQGVGFESGSINNSDESLFVLTFLYAVVPCLLKVIALVLLATTKLKVS